MNGKQVLVLLAICLFIFCAYLLRPTIWGSDSFYFASLGCGKSFGNVDTPQLSKTFFNSFSCSELNIKIFSFVMLFLATLVVSKTGELISKDYGWLAGVLLFTTNYWVSTWTNFEDDLLGIFILLFALYFFVKAKKQRSIWLSMLSLFFCLAAGLFWKGAFLWLVGFALSSFPALFACIIVFVFLLNMDFGSLLYSITPVTGISENNVFTGVFYQLGLLLGVLNLYGFMFPQAAFWLFVGFMNEKFAPILSIYLALCVVSWLEKPMFLKGLRDSFISHGWKVVAVLLIPMVVVSGFKLFTAYPTEDQIEAVKFAVGQAGGGTVFNDWSYGYWVLYYGGVPQKASGPPDENLRATPGVYLTERIIPCNLLGVFPGGFNSAIRVYRC